MTALNHLSTGNLDNSLNSGNVELSAGDILAIGHPEVTSHQPSQTSNSPAGANAGSGSGAHFQSAFPQQILKVREGEVLFKAGEAPRGVYYLKSGAIKIVTEREWTRGRANNPEFINKLVTAGEFFGFKPVLQGQNYPFYAKALKASEVYVYPKELLNGNMQTAENSVAAAVIQQMAKDLENLEHTAQLHYLASVQERIAFQLAVLAERFGVQTSEGLSLNLRLTRSELAQLAGTINESLSRHLTELKSEGIIDVHGKEIVVKNLQKLKELSGNFHRG